MDEMLVGMTTWFTADLHLDQNIIKYCDRPFSDVRSMNESLISNWNSVVGDDDSVWVVGDFALGKIAKTLPLAADLNGRKILVAGNHDRCWAGHGTKAEGWSERYLDAGFDEIIQGSVVIEIGGRKVLVSHFPYRGDSQDQDRFVEQRPADTGRWLVHGHVHERWVQSERMVNVGVDVTGFRPINITEIAHLIAEGPARKSARRLG